MTRASNFVPTFDGAPPPGTINLGIGQPSADLLPVEILRHAGERYLGNAHPLDLNYGTLRGDERYLVALANFLSNEYQATVSAAELMVTAGNSQALDLVASVFAKPGDVVFVEEPSYFLAFQIFRDHDLQIVSIPTDRNGLDIGALEEQLKRHSPAFIYTIPTFHNPGGFSMDLDRREKLVALSLQFDFLIIADEVYHSLYFETPPPNAIGTFANSGQVISLGSFSKILAPALRLGWLHASPQLLQRATQSGVVNSGGAISHFVSHIARQALQSGELLEHIQLLRRTYHTRALAMDAALTESFADLATWLKPEGGYFFWVVFNNVVDIRQLRELAPSHQTGLQSGDVFSVDGNHENCMRLCFSHYNPTDIAEGVRRIRHVFDAHF